MEKVSYMNQLIYSLPYEKEKLEKFSIILHSINARSMVAIEEWTAFQDKYGKDVDLKRFERKALIIDMEKPRLFVRWLYHTWKLPRLQ